MTIKLLSSPNISQHKRNLKESGASLFTEMLKAKSPAKSVLLQVAWLHSEKGIIAVFPDMVAQNDRFSSTFDNRYR